MDECVILMNEVGDEGVSCFFLFFLVCFPTVEMEVPGGNEEEIPYTEEMKKDKQRR